MVALTTATAREPTSRSQVARGLGRHERHHSVRAALQLDLGHQSLDLDTGDEADEPIARAAPHRAAVVGRSGDGDRACGELITGDDLSTRVVSAGAEQAVAHPSAYGVVAHADECRRITDPILRHETDDRSAVAEMQAKWPDSADPRGGRGRSRPRDRSASLTYGWRFRQPKKFVSDLRRCATLSTIAQFPARAPFRKPSMHGARPSAIMATHATRHAVDAVCMGVQGARVHSAMPSAPDADVGGRHDLVAGALEPAIPAARRGRGCGGARVRAGQPAIDGGRQPSRVRSAARRDPDRGARPVGRRGRAADHRAPSRPTCSTAWPGSTRSARTRCPASRRSSSSSSRAPTIAARPPAGRTSGSPRRIALPNVSKPPHDAPAAVVDEPGHDDPAHLRGRCRSIDMSVLARWTVKPRAHGRARRRQRVDLGAARAAAPGAGRPGAARRRAGVTLDEVITTAGNALWVSPLSFLEASTPGTGGFIDTAEPAPRHPARAADPDARGPRPGRRSRATARRSADASAMSPTVVEDHQPLIGDAIAGDAPGPAARHREVPGGQHARGHPTASRRRWPTLAPGPRRRRGRHHRLPAGQRSSRPPSDNLALGRCSSACVLARARHRARARLVAVPR